MRQPDLGRRGVGAAAGRGSGGAAGARDSQEPPGHGAAHAIPACDAADGLVRRGGKAGRLQSPESRVIESNRCTLLGMMLSLLVRELQG